MSIHNLPNEILCSLPQYIDNIESFTNFAATCRRIRNALYTADPNIILRLADGSAPTFFSPHPHFLVAATARQASDWALGNEERTMELREAFQGGIDSLYEFCLKRSGLTLERIREIYLARFSIINPLSDKIDKMAGKQWYRTPRFWDGGVSEPYTIFTEPDRATFQVIIYGELFSRSMDAFLQPDLALHYFNIQTRLDYLTYCIPDWICRSYPGYEVLPTGPYRPELERVSEGDQTALHHILRCGRWRRMWADAIRAILGPGVQFSNQKVEDDNWRKKLLRDAYQAQGLEGMQLVTLPKEKWDPAILERAKRIQVQIERLHNPPAIAHMGKREGTPVSHAPDISNEIEIPCRDMWG